MASWMLWLLCRHYVPLAGANLVDGYWQGKAGIKYDEEVSCAGS